MSTKHMESSINPADSSINHADFPGDHAAYARKTAQSSKIKQRTENLRKPETGQMPRLAYICRHALYLSSYQRLQELEQDRIFCRHQMEHLLDVARIAYILNLERHLEIPREVIYAAALLHDIGKGLQYEQGTPHEIASADIARKILEDMPEELQFTRQEQQQILTAIRGHRSLRKDAGPLEALLYESDKASRACFSCEAEKKCNWSAGKKNMEIRL